MMIKRTFLASIFVASTILAQQSTQDPNTAKGFEPGKLYNFHGIDSVAPGNGNLNVRIPIGQAYTIRPGFSYQFSASYNSKIWRYAMTAGATGLPTYRNAFPENDSNAAFGWYVGLGRIIIGEAGSGEQTTYQSADGARHELISSTLRSGITPVTGYSYATDGSYIRAKFEESSGTLTRIILEFPDGIIQTFDNLGNLTDIKDPYGNWVELRPKVVNNQTDYNEWTIRDGFGEGSGRTVLRQHRILWENAPTGRYTETQANFLRRVKKLELAAFPQNGQAAVATYTFYYDDTATIANGACGQPPDVDNPRDPQINVPLLTKIELPDGSFYTPHYLTTEISPCSSGSLDALTLPTKGSIAWTYGEYELAADQCSIEENDLAASAGPWSYTYTGVRQRVLEDASGAQVESTTYTPELLATGTAEIPCGKHTQPEPGFQLPPLVMRNTVVSSSGDKTEHYFAAYHTKKYVYAGSPQEIREYGLPFTRVLWNGSQHVSTAVDGKYLSTRMYAGSNQLQRTTYLKYEGDVSGDSLLNPRVKDTRTVFETDDGDPDVQNDSDTGNLRCKDGSGAVTPCYVDQVSDSFDGFGHYRAQTTKSNFPGVTNGSDSRTVTTNYNPELSSSSNWATTTPWLLNTYDTTSITENNVSHTVSTTVFETGKGVIRSVKRGTGSDALVFRP